MQLDLFEETLDRKILRMDRWIKKLHRQLFLLTEEQQLVRQAYYMAKTRNIAKTVELRPIQADMFLQS